MAATASGDAGLAERREFHPPHHYEANACYFITARMVRRQHLLQGDRPALLRDVLKDAVRDYDITLYAWVILANHYHLLLLTGETIPIFKFIKRLHGKSAILLNKRDATPGRQVWYQYWDTSPRNQRAFWSRFNYIHINPLKHGYVHVADSALRIERRQVKVAPSHAPDVHEALAGYRYSSYHYYLREYGEAFMTDAWMRYPIPEHLANDDA